MTDIELSELCREWKRRLRLQDWDVQVKFCRYFDMGENTQGECAWKVAKKSANISILDPTDYSGQWSRPQNIERTVVHELLHLHFAAVDNFEGLADTCFEQAIDSISCALVP